VRPIGILGGTFDPVHFGHLRSALEVKEALALAEIRLIPSKVPPHREPPMADAAERLAMLQAAVSGESALVVDSRELERPAPSYTFDTLTSLRRELGQSTPLCLLLGEDAFLGLPSWHRWERLIDLAHIVVLDRPQASAPCPPLLGDLLDGREAVGAEDLARVPAGLVLHQRVTQLDISATWIRELVGAGRSPRYLLPDAVWALIRSRGLYAGRQIQGSAPRSAQRGA
jgi:nicotinate-nucleotide adenylyltransferase